MNRSDKYHSRQIANAKGHNSVIVEQRSVLADRRLATTKRKHIPTFTVAKALQFLKDTKC